MNNEKIAEAFSKLRAKLIPVLNELPTDIGIEAVNYSLEAFENQAWEGLSWAQRKSKKDTERAVLVKSGALRRSIKIIPEKTTSSKVVWGSVGIPYAQVHNDGGLISRAARSETFVRPRYERGAKSKLFGGMGAFRKMTMNEKTGKPVEGQSYKSYSFRMTQRRFLGDTPELRQRLTSLAITKIQEALKQL